MSKTNQPSATDPARDDRDPIDQTNEIARLAGGLAHEIKNPLSTIRLNMDLLAEDLGEDDSPRIGRSRKRIGVVQRECQRLQELLDNFLNFAKVRAAKLEPTDLNAEINEILDFFAPQAKESGIEIVRYLDSDLPSVLLDREAFHGALLNLILNADQAMSEGGQLVVRTVATGSSVAIYLIDTGCGMDDRTASQMFDAFFSTKPGGSGLGLPTTSKIIEAHGGQISVESEVGHGTKFTIVLPVPPRLTSSDQADSDGSEDS